MTNILNRYDLFPTPVWHFEMPDWKEVEYDVVELFSVRTLCQSASLTLITIISMIFQILPILVT
jgi:hypothetical protein